LLAVLMVMSTTVIVAVPQGVEAAPAGVFQTEGGWGVEVVDAKGIVGIQSSLAIDDFGYAHIAYRNDEDGTLKYATNAEGFWNITTVDTEVSTDLYSEISLTLDSKNEVHISYMSYYNSEDEFLIYATNAGGSWSKTVVDKHYRAGCYNDIFVDGSDRVHIAYSVENALSDTDLKYANNTAGAWVNETADSGVEVGMYPSIVVDDYGIIHIVYFDQFNVALKWAQKYPSGWSRSYLDDSGECGYFTSMDISGGTDLHVSYFDGAGHLKYQHFDGVQWDLSITTVDSTAIVGEHSSICVDRDGAPSIAYYDSTNSNLKVARFLDGGWNCTTVDDAGASTVGEYCSIAIGPNGKIGVSNYFGGSDDLLYTSQNVWTFEELAGTTGNMCFGNTDIALSDDNNAYISYTANAGYELWLANNFWGSWTYTMVDNTTGDYGGTTSIDLGSNNQVHIAYYAADSGEIRYATKATGNPWVKEKVADTKPNWSTNDLSMQVDSDGKVHIAYSYFEDSGFTATLKYANNVGGTWVNETVDSSSADIGRYPSLALDASNKVHISYRDQTNKVLRYATNAGGSWVLSPIDSSANVGEHTSIAVDRNGRPHVSYMDSANKDLKYAFESGGVWVPTVVDSIGWVGEYSSIGLDLDGKAHISYYDNTNQDLKYATNAGGSWAVSVLDHDGMVGSESGLAIGTDGKVHISYDDASNSQVGYATNSPWDFSTIYRMTGEAAPENYLSMVRDDIGAYHIAFYDTHDTALRYATNRGGVASVTLVDNADDVGQYCSIAVDANGKAHISYYNATGGDLKYAVDTGSGWAKTVVDSTGDVGMFTSIALDVNGKAHISYRNSSGDPRLKYATNAGGSWATVTVDTTAFSGTQTDIAVDANGKAFISYYTGLVGLKLANNTAGSWAITNVDTGAVFKGQNPSLALGGDGAAHISYYDTSSHYLKYAMVKGASVTKRDVDISGNAGSRSSIDVDKAGKAHITYHDQLNGDLRYAVDIGGSWWTTTVDRNGLVGEINALDINDQGVLSVCYIDWTNNRIMLANQKAAPTAPRGLTLVADGLDVQASWSAPVSSNGPPVLGYIVLHSYPSGEVERIIGLSDLSRTDTNLALGVHRYAIAAYNVLGTGPFCAEQQVTIVPQTPPTAPTGLSATPGSGSVSLIWNSPVDSGGSPIQGFKVYRGTSSGTETLLTFVNSSMNYLDLTVTNGVTYYYKVSAFNGYGEGPLSTEVSATPTLSLSVPEAPTNVVTYAHDSRIELVWQAPLSDGGSPITNYKVYRGEASGALVLWSTLGNVLTYQDYSAENGIMYYYAISAVNGVGEGPRSNTVSVLLGSVPSVPMNLGASADGTSIVLSWDPPENDGGWNVSGYKVYRGTSATNLTLLAALGNVVNYTDYEVVAGTEYYYAVSALNAKGEGARSNAIMMSTSSVPSAPNNLEAEAGDAKVTLSWDAPTDDGGSPITGYVIYRGTSEGAVSTVLVTLGNVNTYTDDDVVNGQTYWYKISAVNSIGQGTTTDAVDATPSADAGDSGDNTMLYIIIAIVIVAAIAGAAVLFLRKK